MAATIFIITIKIFFQRSMARARLILLLTILALSAASSPARAYPVKIGVVLPLSGKLQQVGKIELQALKLWIERANEARHQHAPYIKLVVEDSRSDPNAVKGIFERLVIEKHVSALIGGCSSSVAWELAALAAGHQVPFLITTASDDRITEQRWKPVFRLCLPTSEQLRTLGEFLSLKFRPTMVGILRQNSSFGRFGTFGLKRLFGSRHLKVRVIQGYPKGTKCFQYFLARMDKPGLDLLCLVARPQEAALILEQARHMGLRAKMVLGFGTHFAADEFYSAAWGQSQYLCTVTPWAYRVNYPGVSDFKEKFLEAYGRLPTYHAAQAYAALQVLAKAIEMAETLSPEDIIEALKTIELDTIYGPVKFSSYAKKDRQNRPPSLLVQWIKDRQEIIWPKELATSSFHQWK